jgi:hypothetical protein
MPTAELQIQVFNAIKAKLPPHLSLAEEVAATLAISTDSAYRRIRGEKPLLLEEVGKLCARFGLSLDSLLQLQSEGFLFKGEFFQPENFQFDKYLASYAQQMKFMSTFPTRRLFMLCKDIAPHHHFHFREIAAFKHYFWMRTIMNAPSYAQKKFALADYPDELFRIGQTALHYYNQSNSVELWNIETINSTLRQIEYYSDMNLFAHEAELQVIYEKLQQFILHMEKQADAGYKYAWGDEKKTPLAPFQLYYNEVILGDNSVTAVLNNTKVVYIPHSVFNFMATTDVRFCDNAYKHIQNLMKKSTLISNVSERERARFFNYLRHRIAARTQFGPA